MSSDNVHSTTTDLDAAAQLPARNWSSVSVVLCVQALNSFSDNLVKMLLIVFANSVAKGTFIGDKMQTCLGLIFSLPYIFFAPVAGYCSDRFSKQRVIFWMQAAQVLIFLGFIASLWLRQAQLSLVLSLGCFFVLATQAALFSPAKMGILKELVGSRRLGLVSGVQQMSMFAAILIGYWLAGKWFGDQLKSDADSWDSAIFAVSVVTGLAVVQTVGAWFVQRTPEHPDVEWRRSRWWEHFSNLQLVFKVRAIGLAALGIVFFWFMSNAVGTILVGLGKEQFPAADEASTFVANISAVLGVGVLLGSLTSSLICRRRIEMGVVPLAGFVLTVALLWGWLIPPHSRLIYVAMTLTGLAAGAFMVPLYAFVQDRSAENERARVLAGVGLIDCLGGLAANLAVMALLVAGVPSALQLGLVGFVSLAAAIYMTKLLPRPLMMLIVNAVVRLLYRIKVHHPDRMPKEGAVLLLPNHVSYADALVLGVSSERSVRFVMVDSLYKIRSIQWFLKLFGTVPISATKAKEAVRTVGEALDEGRAVVLFPEGQLTRTGFFNEVHKGYQLMARNAEHPVKVQPVWLDGLWGSIFSYEGGRYFRKVPRAWPYRISVWFGEPMDADEGTAERIREAMLALSAEAFLNRDAVRRTPKLALPDGRVLEDDEARVAHVNALRVLETSLLHEGDVVLCLLPPEHAIARTFGVALPQLRGITVCWSINDLLDALVRAKSDERRIVLIGDASTLTDERLKVAERPYAVTVQMHSASTITDAPATVANAYPALYDESTGVLLTLSVPDPQMPQKERSHQLGRKPGSLGHVLPGLAVQIQDGGLVFSRLLFRTETSVRLPSVTLDDEGFVVPRV